MILCAFAKYQHCNQFGFWGGKFDLQVISITEAHKRVINSGLNSSWTPLDQKETSSILDTSFEWGSHSSLLLFFPAGVNPCQDYSCSYYAVCSANTPTTPTCTCQNCPEDQANPICDVYGVTHKCRCEYELAVCNAQKPIPTQHLGGCQRKFHYHLAREDKG